MEKKIKVDKFHNVETGVDVGIPLQEEFIQRVCKTHNTLYITLPARMKETLGIRKDDRIRIKLMGIYR